MIKEGKFGAYEAICLVTIAIGDKVFFTTPGILTRVVGNATWMMTSISCIISLCIFTMLYVLLKRFPGKDLVEIFNISLGKVAGYIFSFIFALFFLSNAGFLVREFSEVLKVYVFYNTPVSVMDATAIIFVAIPVYLGIETIARFSSLVAKALLLSFILLLVLPVKNYNYHNIFPLWGYGIDTTLYYGMTRTSAYFEFFALAVIAGSLHGIKQIRKAGYISLILSGLIMTLGNLCYVFSFSYTTNQELTMPFYVMVRLISYGPFVQRMEPLFMFIWIMATLITLSVQFYCTVSLFCKMHRINDTRPVILQIAVLILCVAIYSLDFPDVPEIYISGLRDMGNILAVLPVIALIFSIIRKKKGGKQNV